MKKRPYRVILIPALICTALLMLFAFYAAGVIGRSHARNIIGERLDILCESIDEKTAAAVTLNTELINKYCSKARVVSIMLSKNNSFYSEESLMEEMLVAIGADVISISDKNGVIEYSTGMSSGELSVLDEFMPAINNKVFSEAVISESGKYIVAGSSRLDEPGVVQIQFPLDILNESGLSEMYADIIRMPVMEHGHLALIDSDSNTYIVHTDSFLNGSAVQFPPEKFSKDEGWFSSEYDGKSVMVKYKKHNDIIAAGILPYSEIYSSRTDIVLWILFSMAVLTVAILLSLRNYIIRKFPQHK